MWVLGWMKMILQVFTDYVPTQCSFQINCVLYSVPAHTYTHISLYNTYTHMKSFTWILFFYFSFLIWRCFVFFKKGWLGCGWYCFLFYLGVLLLMICEEGYRFFFFWFLVKVIKGRWFYAFCYTFWTHTYTHTHTKYVIKTLWP